MAVSEFLVKKIHDQFPDHAIFSEEAAEEINLGAPYRWVIDPIDGTRNFAAGIPFWCVLIAVTKNNDAILGAVYVPFGDQLFFAAKGGGATLNDIPIRVNQQKNIDFAFGHINRSWRRPHTETFTKICSWFIEKTKARTGNYSTILPTCYIASGGVDFIVTNGGHDHDYLAPTLIAREAGALATNLHGTDWQPGQSDLIVANPTLHAEIMRALQTNNLL